MARETRTIATAPSIERRADPATGLEEPHVVGHAAVFDEWTTLYEGRYWTWREVIRPKAFKRAIKEKQDVRSLFNHDSRYVLGRTKSGTLTLKEDDKGLFTDTSMPDTQLVRDLVISPIERGDIDGMSFAFEVFDDGEQTIKELKDGTRIITSKGERITIRFEGERTIEERELLDLNLSDVSPVTYPAYTGTDVALRSQVGPAIEQRIAEMDRPHRASAPRREELRRWLDERATVAGSAGVVGSAARGRK